MTIKEFDKITIGKIYYDVYDSENDLINWFTRDVSQSPDLYRLNMMKKSLHEDAQITSIMTINDVIHVAAMEDPKEHP